jgi:hypothetical protein
VRQFSDEHRAKLRAAKLANPVKYWQGKTRPSPSVETRAKMSASNAGKARHTEESKAKLRAAFIGKLRSEEVKQKMREGWQRPEVQTKAHRPNPNKARELEHYIRLAAISRETQLFPCSKWTYYNGRAFRSSWEARVAKALDTLGVRWQYESLRFHFTTGTYLPDFFLPDINSYWEVKGWFTEKDQKKIASFRASFPRVPFLVIHEEEMKALERAANMKVA